jgi:hypothetical protein
MSDPNPYDPPQTPTPLAPAQTVKRGLGVAAILLLTPLALMIAGGVSCATAMAMVDAVEATFGGGVGLALFLIVSFVPPIVVLVLMICWAIRAARQRQVP